MIFRLDEPGSDVPDPMMSPSSLYNCSEAASPSLRPYSGLQSPIKVSPWGAVDQVSAFLSFFLITSCHDPALGSWSFATWTQLAVLLAIGSDPPSTLRYLESPVRTSQAQHTRQGYLPYRYGVRSLPPTWHRPLAIYIWPTTVQI